MPKPETRLGLDTYFKQLAKHDLLTAQEEKDLSQEIEKLEVTTWRLMFSRPEVVSHILELLEWKVPKLTKKNYINTIRTLSKKLRNEDLDRIMVEKAIKELASRPPWWTKGKTEEADIYVAKLQATARNAMELRNRFVRANLRLVVTMAKRYDRGGMPLTDLIQEGNLGLMHAVSRFDHKRGLRFSTYACWWIRHAIGRALADKAREVRIPVHMLEAQQHLDKLRQKLIGELGRQPTPQEFAKAAKLPLDKLNQTYKYIMGPPISFDSPVHDDDGRSYGDVLPDPVTEEVTPSDTLTTNKLISQIKQYIHHLTPVEIDVLTKRFGLGNNEESTFREIGEMHGLSRERIRQIQNSALDKLKRFLEREHKGVIEV